MIDAIVFWTTPGLIAALIADKAVYRKHWHEVNKERYTDRTRHIICILSFILGWFAAVVHILVIAKEYTDGYSED